MNLLLLLFVSSIDGFFIQKEHSNLIFTKNIVKSFLSDQSSVTVFKSKESKDNLVDVIIEAIESVLPALIYDEITETLAETINDMGDELNVPSRTKCYLAFGFSVDWIYKQLKFFARINTNGKWILFLVNVEKVDVELLILQAYQSHRMLNILIFFIDHREEVYLTFYNPFKLDSFGNRGEMWTGELKQKNVPTVLSKIHKITEKKIEDLQGFELKVSTYSGASQLSQIFDGPIANLFQKTLNCKYKFFQTHDNVYGSRLPNGSLTGELNHCLIHVYFMDILRRHAARH